MQHQQLEEQLLIHSLRDYLLFPNKMNTITDDGTECSKPLPEPQKGCYTATRAQILGKSMF